MASLADLRELVAAMRVLAANHVQSAQAALDGIRKYAEVIEHGIAEGVTLLGTGPAERPNGSLPRPGGVLLVIASEHGFVGRFNERLFDHAAERLDADVRLAIVGERGGTEAAERGYPSIWQEPMATRMGAVLGVARRVAARLAGERSVRVVHARYQRGADYAVEVRTVLPLDPLLLQRVDLRSRPLHHLAVDRLLARLADEYLLAEITRALMESFASENAARLRVMEAADRNIDERLDSMNQRAHALRQEAITAELLDLITGAAASEPRDHAV